MNTLNEPHYQLLMHIMVTKSPPTKCLCCWSGQKVLNLRKMNLRVITSMDYQEKPIRCSCALNESLHIPRLAPAVAELSRKAGYGATELPRDL